MQDRLTLDSDVRLKANDLKVVKAASVVTMKQRRFLTEINLSYQSLEMQLALDKIWISVFAGWLQEID